MQNNNQKKDTVLVEMPVKLFDCLESLQQDTPFESIFEISMACFRDSDLHERVDKNVKGNIEYLMVRIWEILQTCSQVKEIKPDQATA